MTSIGITLGRIGFSTAFGGAGLYIAKVLRLVAQSRREWKRDSISADGIVVEIKAQSPSGEPAYRKAYSPVVEFKTRDLGMMRFTSARWERPNPYVVGQRVRVRYLPSRPKDAELESVAQSVFVPVVLTVMMLVSFLVSAVPWIVGPPQRLN